MQNETDTTNACSGKDPGTPTLELRKGPGSAKPSREKVGGLAASGRDRLSLAIKLSELN